MTDEERAAASREEFGRKSIELAEKIVAIIEAEDWSLVNSALLYLVASGMQEPNLTPEHLEWLHKYVINLHDMVHDRMEPRAVVLIVRTPDAEEGDMDAPGPTPAPRCLH